ncbi:MAG: hypothetical protein ACK5CL_04925 [Sphingomonadales bacterium]
MKTLIRIIPLMLILGSCKREQKQFEGPSLEDLNGPFGMIKPFAASKATVDFSKGETVIFSAEFTKQCDWTITISGDVSKAKKIISGKSRQVTASNAVWDGTTTVLPAFKTEPCKAVLRIDGVKDSFMLTLVVSGIRVPQGLLIADFETGLNPKWTTFIQSGQFMDFKVKSDAFAVQGKNYLNMAGKVTWDWLIGLIDFPAFAYGSSTLTLSSVPEDVYFNCLIYGDTTPNPSRVLFQFKEDDNNNKAWDQNGGDDQFDKEIIVNWQGWKLVSFKYSDLIHLKNGQPAPNQGNSRHNSNNIVVLSMLHLANPSMGAGRTKIDYLIFTDKAPLQL